MSRMKARFRKLELVSFLGAFKKQKAGSRRFERLEIDGHKIGIAIAQPPASAKQEILCPKCQFKNEGTRTYCSICGYVFEPDAAGADSLRLEPWQIKCPGCGKICAQTQKNCIYCGYRLAPLSSNPASSWQGPTEESDDILRQGEEITLNIDGKVFRSTDEVIPLHVKELMLQIKKRGYSKELVDEWVKNRNFEEELKRLQADRKMSELRQTVIWRTLQVAGLVLIMLLYFMFSMMGRGR